MPKQFVPVVGRPLLVHTIEALLGHPLVDGAVVAVPSGWLRHARSQVVPRTGTNKPLRWVVGGATRADSVRRALAKVPRLVARVLVHDGARCCLGSELLDRLFASLERFSAVIPGLNATDTLKKVSATGRVLATLDRTAIRAVQTPQAFDRDVLARAFRSAGRRAALHTDCSSLVEAMGHPVHLVEGDPTNIKVTTGEDLERASRIIERREVTR